MKAFTIFGGTGDLTFRKLLPALYNAGESGGPGADYRILIIGRRDYTDEGYRELAREWVRKYARLPYSEEAFGRFAGRIGYYRMDFSDPAAYAGLEEYYEAEGVDGHIFYLAVAPRFFGVIADGLAAVRGARRGKVILEKPFGESLAAAGELNRRLEAFFDPENIYRIDHYLGKEMVRNIQTIRFTNPIFTNLWDARFIESVQISALEEEGVGTRGGYYDTSGALKDMVQNHLFQILSIVAMERPAQFSGPDMHAEQLKVLRALRLPEAGGVRDALLLGQYAGYRAEKAVAPDSSTETYAALRLFIDNDRWRGAPFYIRTGKKLGRREMQVAVVFRRPSPDVAHDVLLIKIQPTEGVYLQFNIKRPGDTDEVAQAKMDFCQSCSLENRINTPEAYERLLGACIRGERSWFSQWDQIETSWRFVERLRELGRAEGLPVLNYEPGSMGPPEADALLARFGHGWFH
ncbi:MULTISPECIES: glucose-6-phosphate dehydrogenase [Anaerotruncus]|uniref:glucose-6-phosphate dehydrogenase n=1 Tax=Anaerotruncus TaxID=244127 RepID=UPI00208A89A6|nr:glucose-6-phosphate dehydrogenase [Anaerotruncus massiliensis (ex Togo et al. 2019)]GKH46404.1 glucose-6-phosphate 1-dehydrogenase [Oscillospiraceae bacterium]